NDFYTADKLADYLLELKDSGVLTVAWVHGETTRHSVLPVLACDEIVMADKALGTPTQPRHPALGRVAPPDKPLRDKERDIYDRIDAKRWSAAITRKMYDANLVVVKVREKDGFSYRDANTKPAPVGELVPELGRDTVALYTFNDAVKYGLCQKKALNSLNEVLANYPGNLCNAPEHPVAWRVVISGELNGGLREKAERRIRRAVGQKANWLILQLECHGGDGDA